MDRLIIYFLPTILALGIVTSHEDIVEGKIRNKYLATATALAIAIQLILVFAGLISWRYVGLAWVFACFTIITGFVVWQLGWWSPADARLMAVFVLLVPLTSYRFITTQFPPLDLMINSVLPIFLYLLTELLIRTSKKQKLSALKTTLHPKRLGTSALAVFSISWLTAYVYQYFGIQQNYLLNILIIMIVFAAIRKLFNELTLPLLGIIALARIFLNTGYILSKTFLVSFLLMLLIFIIVFGFLRLLSQNAVKKVFIHQLKPGMVLSEGITKQGLPKDVGFSKKAFLFYKTTPLNIRDVKLIRKLHSNGALHFNTMRVHHVTPLAPFIFLGAIITIICQGNIILFIRTLAGL